MKITKKQHILDERLYLKLSAKSFEKYLDFEYGHTQALAMAKDYARQKAKSHGTLIKLPLSFFDPVRTHTVASGRDYIVAMALRISQAVREGEGGEGVEVFYEIK